jgi:FkbM family methyltransferase
MGGLRKQVKKLLESLSGCEIERFGNKSFALIEKKCKENAWFSYRAQIRTIIEKFEIDLIIDVGANEGQFAQVMRSFYTGEILSFEPVSSVFDKLAAAASSDPNWHVHKLALGSQESTQTINISNHTPFSSLLKTNDYCTERFGDSSLGAKEEVVCVRRLDELLNDLVPDIDSKRIFLKLDTQGYDSEVFKGLGNKLKHVIALQSEVSLIPIYEQMINWTASISLYERAGFGVVGMFPVSRDSGRIIEYDCLLIRVDSWSKKSTS